jgi:dsDNA-binding SOS-regulon protein
MNLDLAENTNKLILLVVAGVALLLTLNTYQKQVGKNLAAVLAIVTIVVVGYVAFTLMSRKPVANNANNVNLVNNANNANMLNNVNRNMADNVNMAVNNNVVEVEDEDVENVEGFLGNHNNHSLHKVNHSHNVETFEGGNSNSNAEEEAAEEAAEEVAEVANNSNHPAENGVLKCSDLLPADTNSQWAQVSPSGVGELCTKNILNAGHHVGVNTQGCSLRNANRGLRSEPPNPQVQVSPWLQTTICPDLLRRPLE